MKQRPFLRVAFVVASILAIGVGGPGFAQSSTPIVAVLVFGGLWGFWGVFFAIPLATLVQAVLKAWPTFVQEDVAKQPE